MQNAADFTTWKDKKLKQENGALWSIFKQPFETGVSVRIKKNYEYLSEVVTSSDTDLYFASFSHASSINESFGGIIPFLYQGYFEFLKGFEGVCSFTRRYTKTIPRMLYRI